MSLSCRRFSFHFTVAWVLERYYTEFKERIGTSQMYTIRRLQKSPHLGPKVALKLTKANIFDHVKMRLAAGVKPQTVNQDMTYLRVALKYAGSAWDDCEGIADGAISTALPYMKTKGMVSKSVPRDRLPLDEEIALLRAFFRKQAQHKNTKQPMELLMDWQIASGRRIGETCKLLWEDWEPREADHPRSQDEGEQEAEDGCADNEAQAMLVELERSAIRPSRASSPTTTSP
jgi:integrase